MFLVKEKEKRRLKIVMTIENIFFSRFVIMKIKKDFCVSTLKEKNAFVLRGFLINERISM